MSCGAIAMIGAGVRIENYDAYEIDKYAIKTSQHNFPFIKHHGDVFEADFTVHEGVDYLIGGSPCTFWSIAQKNNRETEASGLGWELFSQYVRALKEAKPKFFIYENNKSMSTAIRKSITDTFGFEPICINSALVSAQNRQRLYWVGKRNEDGTYSKVNVEQPEDRGILLKDVLDNAVALRDKSTCLPANRGGMSIQHDLYESRHTLVAESDALGKELSENEMLYMVRETQDGRNHFDFGHYHDSSDEKSKCITATVAKGVPYNVLAERITLGTGDATPINTTADGKSGTIRATCYKDGIRNIVGNDIDRKTGVAERDALGKGTVRVGSLPRPNGELSDSQGFRIYDICGKAVNIKACATGAGGKTGLYAIPIEWDDNGIPTKATSCADGKDYTVYYVHDGSIEIKGRSYPIKLKDGYYIIRKLTVSECMRLQTVPDWYDFSVVSNSQAYKMLGNG